MFRFKKSRPAASATASTHLRSDTLTTQASSVGAVNDIPERNGNVNGSRQKRKRRGKRDKYFQSSFNFTRAVVLRKLLGRNKKLTRSSSNLKDNDESDSVDHDIENINDSTGPILTSSNIQELTSRELKPLNPKFSQGHKSHGYSSIEYSTDASNEVKSSSLSPKKTFSSPFRKKKSPPSKNRAHSLLESEPSDPDSKVSTPIRDNIGTKAQKLQDQPSHTSSLQASFNQDTKNAEEQINDDSNDELKQTLVIEPPLLLRTECISSSSLPSTINSQMKTNSTTKKIQTEFEGEDAIRRHPFSSPPLSPISPSDDKYNTSSPPSYQSFLSHESSPSPNSYLNSHLYRNTDESVSQIKTAGEATVGVNQPFELERNGKIVHNQNVDDNNEGNSNDIEQGNALKNPYAFLPINSLLSSNNTVTSNANDSITIFGTGSEYDEGDHTNRSIIMMDGMSNQRDDSDGIDDQDESLDSYELDQKKILRRINAYNIGGFGFKRRLERRRSSFDGSDSGSSNDNDNEFEDQTLIFEWDVDQKDDDENSTNKTRAIFMEDAIAVASVIISITTLVLAAKATIPLLPTALSTVFCALFGLYLSYQRRALRSVNDVIIRKNILRNQTSHIQSVNMHLKGRILGLRAKLNRMKAIDDQFRLFARGTTYSPVELSEMVLEARQSREKVKQNIQGMILKTIMKAMLVSNRGATDNFVLNNITLGIINSRMKAIPYITFNPDRFKRAVERYGSSLTALMKICSQCVLNENIRNRDRIFTFHFRT